MQKRVCYVCKKATKDLCKRCKSTYYCSKSCQKSHWMKHKSECFDRQSLELQLIEYDKLQKDYLQSVLQRNVKVINEN